MALPVFGLLAKAASWTLEEIVGGVVVAIFTVDRVCDTVDNAVDKCKDFEASYNHKTGEAKFRARKNASRNENQGQQRRSKKYKNFGNV